MPKNKQEGLIFGITMMTLMSSFMNLFNNFRHGGISLDSLIHALILEPVIFIVVMIAETLFVSRLANNVVKKFASKDVKKTVMIRTLVMVTAMSFIMSIFGLVMSGIELNKFVIAFALTWPLNFIVALLWQVLVAASTAKRILKQYRRYKKNQAKAISTEMIEDIDTV